jgi:hypothetical protein
MLGFTSFNPTYTVVQMMIKADYSTVVMNFADKVRNSNMFRMIFKLIGVIMIGVRVKLSVWLPPPKYFQNQDEQL